MPTIEGRHRPSSIIKFAVRNVKFLLEPLIATEAATYLTSGEVHLTQLLREFAESPYPTNIKTVLAPVIFYLAYVGFMIARERRNNPKLNILPGTMMDDDE